MPSKAERTSQYILETVAPIFNKRGYVGTSMSDLTAATGLTKGAIYGNFESKENLALQAFNQNIRKVVWAIADRVNQQTSASEKLYAITQYYRSEYLDYVSEIGGCPVLNVGLDTHNLNPLLFERVVEIIQKLKNNLTAIIRDGIVSRELRSDLDSGAEAGKIFAMIEGSVFLSTTQQDQSYVSGMMDHIDHFIKTELIA